MPEISAEIPMDSRTGIEIKTLISRMVYIECGFMATIIYDNHFFFIEILLQGSDDPLSSTKNLISQLYTDLGVQQYKVSHSQHSLQIWCTQLLCCINFLCFY